MEEMIFHYQDAIRNYFTFSGRLSRRGFWLFYLAANIILILSASIDSKLAAGGLIFNLVALFHIIPYFSALARRLHDAGYATWMLIPCVVPLIAILYASAVSQKGPNRFGSEPVPYSREVSQNSTAKPRQPNVKPSSDKPSEPPIEKLERLTALRDKGAITDAQFDELKRQLLGTTPVQGRAL
ncbi:DUF805 domain-containing protein [Mesorhizobium sp. CO1-1-8]|uniref:DUF805 domain-containing protein n=1 Tax=Mesorhizobium sp. CO1-1-8 TaxID=2876631 RepID=UPI001CD1589B|nr:DUF805 domain-containing protein [Mesorhizobium sp. CO1-1-8]MBZ9774061.1 DUF805 domain-containing protein [Mesorhizobium sp. CO1-1-8]